MRLSPLAGDTLTNMMPALAADSGEYVFRLRYGHTRGSVASLYRHFDSEALEKWLTAISVPGEKSNHQIDADVAMADHREPVGRGATGLSRVRQT